MCACIDKGLNRDNPMAANSNIFKFSNKPEHALRSSKEATHKNDFTTCQLSYGYSNICVAQMQSDETSTRSASAVNYTFVSKHKFYIHV